MAANRRVSLLASAAFALAALTASAQAQQAAPGDRTEPSTTMGPGMMGRGMCGPSGSGFVEWQTRRLERRIEPTDAQRAKFDEYKAASGKAMEIMRAACPTALPQTAPARMELMAKRTEATLQAINTVRPALDAFYATLTDDQKEVLDSGGGRRHHRHWRD